MSSRLLPTGSRAALVAGVVLLAACGSGEPATVRIPGEMACTPSDLGDGYFMLLEGEVSVRNLADLSDDAPRRERELRSAGLRGGRFSYWKEQVGRPPFDAPAEVLCQALEFESAAQAERFVRELTASAGELATTAMKWLPKEHRAADEMGISTPSALPAGTRAFRLAASGDGAEVEMHVVMAANGRYVQSAYVSAGRGIEAALNILGNVTGRTQLLATPR